MPKTTLVIDDIRIGSRRSAMGVWLGPIGLKAKDWGGMGISVQGGIKVTGGLTANF